ncbi:hypothetical protein [Bosea sp. (in: a-proteobacteria)]|uniref:hypothetical protein n=1 Tax=Bosea sp. (in: a-proteobacteria) TaxID=1871050 RepID=UPI0026120344|nr:hypothetical protein [Bosea sp. (in: a-proteobacteria)]MCO5091805.1 hypothetical protein [Bosea sp. (in: a-proteobacteria)]
MAGNRMARWGLAAAFAFAAAPGAEAAGLFDDLARALFGGGPRLRASPIYEFDEAPRIRAPRPRAPEVSAKPAPPVVQLDPQTDRHWYLKDPTLRRGDIVVTAGGVLVYRGRDADAIGPADFVALGGGDGKGWKQQLQSAAAGGRARFGTEAAPAKAVTAEAAE